MFDWLFEGAEKLKKGVGSIWDLFMGGLGILATITGLAFLASFFSGTLSSWFGAEAGENANSIWSTIGGMWSDLFRGNFKNIGTPFKGLASKLMTSLGIEATADQANDEALTWDEAKARKELADRKYSQAVIDVLAPNWKKFVTTVKNAQGDIQDPFATNGDKVLHQLVTKEFDLAKALLKAAKSAPNDASNAATLESVKAALGKLANISNPLDDVSAQFKRVVGPLMRDSETRDILLKDLLPKTGAVVTFSDAAIKTLGDFIHKTCVTGGVNCETTPELNRVLKSILAGTDAAQADLLKLVTTPKAVDPANQGITLALIKELKTEDRAISAQLTFLQKPGALVAASIIAGDEGKHAQVVLDIAGSDQTKRNKAIAAVASSEETLNALLTHPQAGKFVIEEMAGPIGKALQVTVKPEALSAYFSAVTLDNGGQITDAARDALKTLTDPKAAKEGPAALVSLLAATPNAAKPALYQLLDTTILDPNADPKKIAQLQTIFSLTKGTDGKVIEYNVDRILELAKGVGSEHLSKLLDSFGNEEKMAKFLAGYSSEPAKLQEILNQLNEFTGKLQRDKLTKKGADMIDSIVDSIKDGAKVLAAKGSLRITLGAEKVNALEKALTGENALMDVVKLISDAKNKALYSKPEVEEALAIIFQNELPKFKAALDAITQADLDKKPEAQKTLVVSLRRRWEQFSKALSDTDVVKSLLHDVISGEAKLNTDTCTKKFGDEDAPPCIAFKDIAIKLSNAR